VVDDGTFQIQKLPRGRGCGGFKVIGHPPSIYFKLEGARVSAIEELEGSEEIPFAWVYIYEGYSIRFEI
jgi:hypothetical protein